MAAADPVPPWAGLATDVSDRLAPLLPGCTEAILAEIPRQVPEYARPLEGRFGEGVREGVALALRRFLDLPGTRRPGLDGPDRLVYEQLGRGEMRQGRRLESLLTAYRLGARVTYRSFAQQVADRPVEELIALAESIFAYIDEISAASAEGYAAEQSEQAGEHGRRRGDLARLLLTGAGDEAALRRTGAELGWTMPRELVAALIPADRTSGLGLALGPQPLLLAREDDVVAVLAAPVSSRTRAELTTALSGRSAVIGPARHWRQLASSLRMATIAAAADRRNRPDPMWVDEHLSAVLLAAEPQAVADLAQRCLAPLAGLRGSQRERLTETLLAWLRHRGHRAPMAGELHVHTQTIGYRVAQLKELFGERLETDPDLRFELELVLRAGKY